MPCSTRMRREVVDHLGSGDRTGIVDGTEIRQQPVAKTKSVLRTGAHGPLPLPGRKPGLVPFMPQRTNLGDEFGKHVS